MRQPEDEMLTVPAADIDDLYDRIATLRTAVNIHMDMANLWHRRYESCRMGMLIMAAAIGCLLIGLIAVLLWR